MYKKKIVKRSGFFIKSHAIVKKNAKDKILEATFALLLEKGADHVSITDIQNKLGISRGLLYCYFKDKTELVFEACRRYFFDRYLENIDFDNISLKDLLSHVSEVVVALTKLNGRDTDIIRYNTLCSNLLLRNPEFRNTALEKFTDARKVIRNAIKNGEIKNLPESFVGATLLAILGRTSYITATPSESYVRTRILEDIETFYKIIKK